MRLTFYQQVSKTTPHQSKSKPTSGQWLTIATKLTALLLILIAVDLLPQQTAEAETARIDDITIDRQPDETYDSLIQRAETAATAALSQGFSQGSQITDVSVIILGQNQGAIAPVLAIDLSRPQWNSRRNEFTYFNSARSLLLLDEQPLAVADSPPTQGNTPSASPPAQQPNNPPGSARQIINNTPIQPVNPPPSAAPLPGSPALVPRPQAPGVTPVTSPGDNFNPTLSPATPTTAPTGNNFNPTSSPATPTTAPTRNNFNPTSSPATPTTAPTRNNFNPTSSPATPTTAPTRNNFNPAPSPVTPTTAPTSENLPQVNPANTTPN